MKEFAPRSMTIFLFKLFPTEKQGKYGIGIANPEMTS